MQSKVVIALHSRLKDIENIQVIIRALSSAAVQMVFDCLGVLNVINPMVPANDYKLSFKYMDNRLFTHALCTLASNESGDQLKENSRTDILIIDLFAAMGRVLSDEQDKFVIFSYCEIGERTCAPNWQYRRDFLSKFLIGTKPMDTEALLRPQVMYKELEAAGSLSVGPIDLQYRQYLKLLASPEKKGGNKSKQQSF
jgi:hypothetical protein